MFSKLKFLVTGLIVLCLCAGAALAENTEGTIKAIKDAGVLRAAVAESLPMQFKDPKTGQWEGYNVDMAKDLAEVLGVKLELVDATWQTLIPGLMAKQYDIVMVDMWATPERAQTVVFTNPYNVYGWAVMIRSDLAATKWEDLDTSGTTISVLSGTADEQTAKRFFPKANVHGLVSENVNAPRMEVANGRTDAHVTDLLNIKIFMAQNPDAKVKLLQPERIMNSHWSRICYSPWRLSFSELPEHLDSARREGGKADELKKKWITDYDWSKKQ